MDESKAELLCPACDANEVHEHGVNFKFAFHRKEANSCCAGGSRR